MAQVHHYFAYGSNLLKARLAARVPVEADLGLVSVAGWRLAFHKRGRDGSGKGDLVRDPHPQAVAYGAVYRLSAAALDTLNRIEGVGAGYALEEIMIPAIGPCYCYLAEPTAIEPGLLPFDWYVELVRAGAAARNAPANWQQRLAGVPTRADPDVARAAAARALLTVVQA